MVLITIVTGAYKPTYNWGGAHCRITHFLTFQRWPLPVASIAWRSWKISCRESRRGSRRGGSGEDLDGFWLEILGKIMENHGKWSENDGKMMNTWFWHAESLLKHRGKVFFFVFGVDIYQYLVDFWQSFKHCGIVADMISWFDDTPDAPCLVDFTHGIAVTQNRQISLQSSQRQNEI